MNNKGILNRLVRFFLGRIRLFGSLFFGMISSLILAKLFPMKFSTQIILSFDLGVILFLIISFKIMFFSSGKDILKRAATHEEGKIFVLFLVLGSAAMSLVAIVAQLSMAKELMGLLKLEHISLCAVTILVSWIFIQIMFAIHYAHDFYLNLSKNKSGGLEFPGKELPEYSDFFYLACSIGTSGQTADVGFSDKKMRLAGIAHGIFSFFFNATIFALMINILSDLI